MLFSFLFGLLSLITPVHAQQLPDSINPAQCVTSAPQNASRQDLESALNACTECRDRIMRDYTSIMRESQAWINRRNELQRQYDAITNNPRYQVLRRNGVIVSENDHTTPASSPEWQALDNQRSILQAEYDFLARSLENCRNGDRYACAQATRERLDANYRARVAHNQAVDRQMELDRIAARDIVAENNRVAQELMPYAQQYRERAIQHNFLIAHPPRVDCSSLEPRVARSRRSSGQGGCTSNDQDIYHWYSAMACGVMEQFYPGTDPEGQALARCEAQVQRRSQDQRNYRGCRSGTPCVRGCGTALPAL